MSKLNINRKTQTREKTKIYEKLNLKIKNKSVSLSHTFTQKITKLLKKTWQNL